MVSLSFGSRNRGGKGLGVQLFLSSDSLAAYLTSDAYEAPVDGLHLLQEYVRAPRLIITRAEFVGGRFLYAVEVDTSDGFELCPADVCAIGDANCPVGETPQREKFTILDGIADPLRVRLERFLTATGVEVAGIEFIVDTEGRTLVYDVNTNTNYNPDAEARAGRTGTARSGPGAIAEFLAASCSDCALRPDYHPRRELLAIALLRSPLANSWSVSAQSAVRCVSWSFG